MRLALGRYEEAVHRRAAKLATGAEAIWRRDPSFWNGGEAKRATVANRLGWLDAPQAFRARLPELEEFSLEVQADGFTDAVVLGMGGSSLAPEVVRRSIAERARGRSGGLRLHVLDTTDPATILATRREVDVARTLFFVSSKSGSTIEANALFEYFEGEVQHAVGRAPGRNFVAITDPGTSLEALSKERGFRRVFLNPADIGGRYSALSYFGLVPPAVAGVDVAKLLMRGEEASLEAMGSESESVLLGAAIGELALAGRDKLTFIVSPELRSFGLWAEQLIAESTGKEGLGIVPVDGEPLVRPRQYGADRAFIYLRLEADNNGHADATVGALVAEGAPVIRIDLRDEYDVAHEFFRWEFAVVVAAKVLGINPFDEPNVQESKDNTNRVLSEFERTQRLDNAALDDKMPVAFSPQFGASGLLQGIERLLERLVSSSYFAITAYVQQTEESDAAFAELRKWICAEYGVATTLGYGPRYLHSTGQLHKGGPSSGVFLQVTAVDQEDVSIPGRSFTFGQLKRAQAIGDLESLAAHGRPALRAHLQRDVPRGLRSLVQAVQQAAGRRA